MLLFEILVFLVPMWSFHQEMKHQKSELLREADQLNPVFADGICFVDLTAVRDPLLVLPTIGRVVGLQESGERPIAEAVADFLRPKAVLLILDNCATCSGLGFCARLLTRH
jgi:predicted ATPase